VNGRLPELIQLLLTERQAAVGLLAYRLRDINDLIENTPLPPRPRPMLRPSWEEVRK
jgi:hypothetical protein